MHNLALIVAAGRGTRLAEAANGPKQYADLGGQAMLARTLAAFLTHPRIGAVLTAIHPDDRPAYDSVVQTLTDTLDARLAGKLRSPVPGGATRQESVRWGLEALAGVKGTLAETIILIHDAARPFVSARVIDQVLEGVARSGGAIAALPVVDTLKKESPGAAGSTPSLVGETLPRDGLWRAQTPQGFRLNDILAAHATAAAAARNDFTDDAAIAEWAGLPVALVPGEEANAKITTAADLAAARQRVEQERQPMETRIGNGFDVHRFADGNSVWLCGVEIPHERRLDGHSDADVGLHALTDAILGALGDGDIGQHFPPSDPQWKGAASHIFLADAARRVANRGGRIVNVDVTLLCERPKVGPHREAMRGRLAEILGIDIERVAVKATTTERLGFTGREEGIAAIASAAVALPTAQL